MMLSTVKDTYRDHAIFTVSQEFIDWLQVEFPFVGTLFSPGLVLTLAIDNDEYVIAVPQQLIKEEHRRGLREKEDGCLYLIIPATCGQPHEWRLEAPVDGVHYPVRMVNRKETLKKPKMVVFDPSKLPFRETTVVTLKGRNVLISPDLLPKLLKEATTLDVDPSHPDLARWLLAKRLPSYAGLIVRTVWLWDGLKFCLPVPSALAILGIEMLRPAHRALCDKLYTLDREPDGSDYDVFRAAHEMVGHLGEV